jgi:O-antigen/teichoic acid export membrane protein
MNKYLRAISTNYIFFIINVIFFLLVTPLAIKAMGEEFYGLWMILTALMLFLNIGNLGIDTIVLKFSAESHFPANAQLKSNQILTVGYLIAFIMSIITASSFLLARNLIVNNINMNIELKAQFQQAILWVAAGIIPQFLIRVPYGFLLSQLRNRTARQFELFSSISLWMGAVVIALIEKNLVYIAIWCFISNWLVFGFYILASWRLVPFRFQLEIHTLKMMLNFSKYMFLETLAISLFSQFDRVVVGFMLGPVIAGVYSTGTSLASRLSMVTGQATEVMIPYASLQESLDDRQKLYTVFRKLSRYVSLLLAGLSSLLIIWMNDFLSLWISPDYAARYANGFRILVIAYGLLSLCRPAHQTLTGIGKVKFTSLVYLFSTILMLVSLIFLSREFGFQGAVASNLLLILLLVFNLFLYVSVGSPIRWKHVLVDLQWGLGLPVIIFGLTLFLSSSMPISSLMEMIILGILLALAITKDDKNYIKTGIFRIKQLINKSLI